MMKRYITIILICFAFISKAQIPVEVFGGHRKTTVDFMFFKFLKKKQGENSHWLFFNRNRAIVDYRMTKTTFLPQFGFTEAVSYNHPKLKGFAPVAVVQIFNSGVFPKAGIQYARIKKELTIFSWIVCETLKGPDLDFFLLFRFTPKLTAKLNLFTQIETVNAFPTNSKGIFNITQRSRLGLKIKDWQFGAGADLNEIGNNTLLFTYNFGGFLRHEF